MQLAITIAIVAVCLVMVVRALARSLFPGRFKAAARSSCCSGGCPALKQPADIPATTGDRHRPAA